MSWIHHLNDVPLAGLMLVVTLGFLLGRLEWRGLSIGPAGGTLAVAITGGFLGLSFRDLYGGEPRLTLGAFGFALFIYSVGFEAGPRFFASLRGGKGWQFPFLGALVTGVGLVVALTGARLLGLGEAVTAGLLAGALTSSPTYAAAMEVCDDPAVLAVSFAATFPIGLIGVVLLTQFLPRWMGDDLTSESEEDDLEAGPAAVRGSGLRRVYEVTRDEVVGKSLADLDFTRCIGCYITHLHRGDRIFTPDRDTRLLAGDHVMAEGRLDDLGAFERRVGPEVYDDELRHRLPSPRAIRVTRGEVDGKTLHELDLFRRYRSLVTRVIRQGEVIEPSAELALQREDTVLVIGDRQAVRAAERFLGRFERSTQETDIAIYAGGIFVGLLIGEIHLAGIGFDVGLGRAAGLLLIGVLLGRFRQLGPFSAHLPLAARQLVRDLGILLFIAETGVLAGGSSLAGLEGLIVPTLAWSVLVTVIPVLTAVFVGRRLLAMRPVDVWGSIGGGMTSSSALVVLRRAADSSEPAISYTASYAVASVLATLAGQLVVLLV